MKLPAQMQTRIIPSNVGLPEVAVVVRKDLVRFENTLNRPKDV